MDWKGAFAGIEGAAVHYGGTEALQAAGASALLPIRVGGGEARDKESLMTALAAKMNFPPYFGRNWDALRDCLTDLDEFLPAQGWLLVVTDAAEILKGNPADRALFLETLESAAEFWRRADPPRAFKTLLIT